MKLPSLALTAALALAACAPSGEPAKDASSASPAPSSAVAPKTTAARPASTAAHVAKKPKSAPAPTVAPTTTAAVPAVYVASDPPEDTSVPAHVAVPTVLSQGNSVAELKITAGIRRAVMFDFSLGFAARNIQIITMGTKVTLRGVVKSDHERTIIESHARQQAGVSAVDNLLALEN